MLQKFTPYLQEEVTPYLQEANHQLMLLVSVGAKFYR